MMPVRPPASEEQAVHRRLMLFGEAESLATPMWVQRDTTCQAIAGPTGLLQDGGDGAAGDGWIDWSARDAPVTTIYGGTSEIQRNLIAERHLGLPKSR